MLLVVPHSNDENCPRSVWTTPSQTGESPLAGLRAAARKIRLSPAQRKQIREEARRNKQPFTMQATEQFLAKRSA